MNPCNPFGLTLVEARITLITEYERNCGASYCPYILQDRVIGPERPAVVSTVYRLSARTDRSSAEA